MWLSVEPHCIVRLTSMLQDAGAEVGQWRKPNDHRRVHRDWNSEGQ